MRKKIRVPGEKTKVICENCAAPRSATWGYDDFVLSDGTVVKGAMVAKCDSCQEQAGLAGQSSYLIREAREKKQKRLRTSVTLSQPLRDLAESRVNNLGSSSMSAVEAVVLSLIAILKRSPQKRERLVRMLRAVGDDPLLKGNSLNVRVPLRLSKAVEDIVDEISSTENFNRSEFVRRAILLDDDELEESLQHYAIL